MTNETLSERFAELFERYHRNSCYPFAEPFEAKAFADEAMAILAERPTPSPDATEAARAMREAAAKGREAVDRAKEALAWIATNMSGVSLFDWNEKANAILSGLNFATNPIYVLPTPQPDERDEALRVAKEAVQAKITKAQIQCDKHAPMGGIKYLSWFGRLAGLKDALASIAAAKSKGGEG